MLAHWMLWNGADLEQANRHFAAALRSGRERAYVRRLQLAALANRREAAGHLEMLRVANDMRKGGEPLDPDGRDRMWSAYYDRFVVSAPEKSTRLPADPPAEQVATYRWVFERTRYVESKGPLYEYVLARLQDAAGQDAEALATYRSVRSKIPDNVLGQIRGAVDSAIGRLTKRP
jgi:hypothetical protein